MYGTQSVEFDVIMEGNETSQSANDTGKTWVAQWPIPWTSLDWAVAAINAIEPDGSSPSHLDHIKVLSGKHLRNVSGELMTMSGLQVGETLTFKCVAVGGGEITEVN